MAGPQYLSSIERPCTAVSICLPAAYEGLSYRMLQWHALESFTKMLQEAPANKDYGDTSQGAQSYSTSSIIRLVYEQSHIN